MISKQFLSRNLCFPRKRGFISYCPQKFIRRDWLTLIIVSVIVTAFGCRSERSKRFKNLKVNVFPTIWRFYYRCISRNINCSFPNSFNDQFPQPFWNYLLRCRLLFRIFDANCYMTTLCISKSYTVFSEFIKISCFSLYCFQRLFIELKPFFHIHIVYSAKLMKNHCIPKSIHQTSPSS